MIRRIRRTASAAQLRQIGSVDGSNGRRGTGGDDDKKGGKRGSDSVAKTNKKSKHGTPGTSEQQTDDSAELSTKRPDSEQALKKKKKKKKDKKKKKKKKKKHKKKKDDEKDGEEGAQRSGKAFPAISFQMTDSLSSNTETDVTLYDPTQWQYVAGYLAYTGSSSTISLLSQVGGEVAKVEAAPGAERFVVSQAGAYLNETPWALVGFRLGIGCGILSSFVCLLALSAGRLGFGSVACGLEGLWLAISMPIPVFIINALLAYCFYNRFHVDSGGKFWLRSWKIVPVMLDHGCALTMLIVGFILIYLGAIDTKKYGTHVGGSKACDPRLLVQFHYDWLCGGLLSVCCSALLWTIAGQYVQGFPNVVNDDEIVEP